MVEAKLAHAGTSIDLRYAKSSDYDLCGAWDATELGEWGLRFWFVLCLSSEGGETWRFDAARNVATVTVGPRTLALATAPAPLLVTGHDSIEALADEYESHGYWYLESRASDATMLANSEGPRP